MYSPPLSSTTSLTTPNVSWYLNLTSRSSPLPQVVQTDQVQSSTWTGTRPGQARSPHWALCLPSSAAGSVQACQSVGQYNVRREEIKTLSKQIPCNLVFKNNFSSIEMSFLSTCIPSQILSVSCLTAALEVPSPAQLRPPRVSAQRLVQVRDEELAQLHAGT